MIGQETNLEMVENCLKHFDKTDYVEPFPYQGQTWEEFKEELVIEKYNKGERVRIAIPFEVDTGSLEKFFKVVKKFKPETVSTKYDFEGKYGVHVTFTVKKKK